MRGAVGGRGARGPAGGERVTETSKETGRPSERGATARTHTSPPCVEGTRRLKLKVGVRHRGEAWSMRVCACVCAGVAGRGRGREGVSGFLTARPWPAESERRARGSGPVLPLSLFFLKLRPASRVCLGCHRHTHALHPLALPAPSQRGTHAPHLDHRQTSERGVSERANLSPPIPPRDLGALARSPSRLLHAQHCPGRLTADDGAHG